MEFSDALTPVGIGLLLSLGSATAAIASPTEAQSLSLSDAEPTLTWQAQVKQEDLLRMSLLDAPTAEPVEVVLLSEAEGDTEVAIPVEEPSVSSASTEPAAWQAQVKQGELLWMSLLDVPTADESSLTSGEEATAQDTETPVLAAEGSLEADAGEAAPPPSTEPSLEIETDFDPDLELEPELLENADPDLVDEADPEPDSEPLLENDEEFGQLDISNEVEFPRDLEANPNLLDFPTVPEDVLLEDVQAITLEQAAAIAERNNPELYAARLEVERQFAALREQQAALYPRLSVGGNLTAQEGQQQQQISNINPFTGEVQFEESGDDIDVILGGNVRVDYDLFTSGRRSALIEAAEDQLELQRLQVETQLAELRLDVAQSYYGLQEADERLRIFRDSLAQAEQNLQDARALERAGVGTRFDVLQAEVEVANRQQDLINALRDQAVARRQLAQLLSIPPTINLAAADPIEVAADWPLSLEESIVRAYRNRAELEQRLLERQITDNQRRAAIAQYGPQVSAFAQYSTQNQLTDEDSGFIDDYRLGVELSLNLFDGGASVAQARQQAVGTEVAEANFASARDAIRFQVEQAYFSLLANDTNIETTTLNVERATESLRLARLRFQAGVGTQSDVLRAQTELTQAEVDRLNAILGYNQSLAELRRAVSNWPDNELQDVP